MPFFSSDLNGLAIVNPGGDIIYGFTPATSGLARAVLHTGRLEMAVTSIMAFTNKAGRPVAVTTGEVDPHYKVIFHGRNIDGLTSLEFDGEPKALNLIEGVAVFVEPFKRGEN